MLVNFESYTPTYWGGHKLLPQELGGIKLVFTSISKTCIPPHDARKFWSLAWSDNDDILFRDYFCSACHLNFITAFVAYVVVLGVVHS